MKISVKRIKVQPVKVVLCMYADERFSNKFVPQYRQIHYLWCFYPPVDFPTICCKPFDMNTQRVRLCNGLSLTG